MKLLEIKNAKRIVPNITNKNFWVDSLSDKKRTQFLPNIEFGKTYYVKCKGEGNGMWELFGVKFYGLIRPAEETCQHLIGSLSDGRTIYYGSRCRFFTSSGNEFTDCEFGLYNTPADYDANIQVENIQFDYIDIDIINYLYPNKFKTYEKDDKVCMFRYYWDGAKTMCGAPCVYPRLVFFEKPLTSLWLKTYEYRWWKSDIPSCFIGKLLSVGNGNGHVDAYEKDDKIKSYINKSYISIEECERNNKIKVNCFEGEEVENNDNKNSHVYISLIGYVSIDDAKQILSNLEDVLKK